MLNTIKSLITNRSTYIPHIQSKSQVDLISRWEDAFTDKQWVMFILSEIKGKINKEVKNIILLETNNFAILLQEEIKRYKVPLNIYIITLSRSDKKINILSESFPQKLNPSKTLVIACSTSNLEVTQMLSLVLAHPKLKFSDFIFKIRPESNLHHGRSYISPIIHSTDFSKIYADSLKRCEMKCEIEEAHEIYQALIQTRHIPGAIIEFGSYRGHSGFIVSKIVNKLGKPRQVYLCDTFDTFPNEIYAVDKFWSQTHSVDFRKIKQLFKPFPNVKLVRGDFTDIISTISEKRFSFVYVDCDSYRATKLVSQKIFPKLNVGGIMIYEDYGHAQCLGARYAVDEYFNHVHNASLFFSQSSGCMIVVKCKNS